MTRIKTAVFLLLETEKMLIEQIHTAELRTSGKSILVTEKCQAMINSFLNIILKDQLRLEQKIEKIKSPENTLDINFFLNDFLFESNVIFDMVKASVISDDIIAQISQRIISMRLKYLSFKSSNPNLFS